MIIIIVSLFLLQRKLLQTKLYEMQKKIYKNNNDDSKRFYIIKCNYKYEKFEFCKKEKTYLS